jgi:hypothetical protein
MDITAHPFDLSMTA